jgi:hypothetical protein
MKFFDCGKRACLVVVFALSAACGGGGDDGGSGGNNPPPPPPPPPPVTVTIGGTVSGLTGTLVVRNNGSDDLTIASDGAFTFSTSLATGVAYAVSIATQPANQSCAVTKGTGTTGAANITDVTVTCAGNAVTAPTALSYPSPQSYAVGVAITPLNPTVTGTVTSYVVSPALPAGLALNASTGQITGTPSAASAAENYVITATNSGGSTTFALTITVTAAGDFIIGGTVTGLTGTGLVLRNNGGDDLTVATSGAVTFSSPLASGTAYAVVVKTQPVLPGQLCTVTNGKGTVGGANVTNVAIDCVGSSFADTDRDGLTDEVEARLGTDPATVDSDGDTLGDGEEVLLRGTDPLKTDTEGDEVSDNNEVANGTDPNFFDTDGDLIADKVDPYPWRADGDGDGVPDINDPSPLLRDADGGGASDGAELRAGTDPFSPGDDRPSIDSDHDFLTDNDEIALGTDPFDADSDNDLTLDGFEAGTCDPLKLDTDADKIKDSVERAQGSICDQADSDHDGLVDSDEVGATVPDRDSDGLIDGVEERVYHSSSEVQDTDNDGLNDGDEVNVRRTDPVSADTDCDGVKDGQEVSAGTDPLHGPTGSTCSL